MTAKDPREKSAGSEIVPSFGSFDRAVILVLAHEGGYADNPRDPGGETRYGISKKQYPHLDIKNLTIEDAKEIYRRDYWDQHSCGDMPWPLAFVMFDCVVQFHPKNPIRWLQEAMRLTADGILGPRTIEAARKCPDPVGVALKIMQERSEYRTRHPQYAYFGKGWRRRDLSVMCDAVRFYYVPGDERNA